jgi:hypothetical protein
VPPAQALLELLEPWALQVLTESPSQVTALGVQTCALHRALALSQYCVALQSVVTVPEPSELQVLTELPRHIGTPGEQTCALQLVESASQYCVAVQLCVTVEDRPSSAHVTTLLPEQTLVLGAQTCVRHSPLLQVVSVPQTCPPPT